MRAGLPLVLGLAALAGCTLEAPPPAPAPGGPLTLAALAGRYDSTAAACTAPAVGEGRMTIAPAKVTFYESECQVVSQAPSGAGLRASLLCRGEGTTWTDTMIFTPTAGGGVEVFAGETRTTRVRCS